MRGCQFIQDGDQLTIRPTAGTLGGPLMACIILGGAIAFAVFRLVQLPNAELKDVFAQPMVWFYAILNPLLFGAALLWYWVGTHPVTLDRSTNELDMGNGGKSFAGAVAVVVHKALANESADSYHVEIVIGDRRLRVGRAGWTDETDRERAEQNAARIAEFLGLPVGLALVS